MTNQASEDEPTKSKVDWSTPYDEWLIPILNRFRYGGAIECRAIPSEIQLNIEALIRTEKLKLLDNLERKSTHYTSDGLVADGLDPWAVSVSTINATRNKLEAEL